MNEFGSDSSELGQMARAGMTLLAAEDPELFGLLANEHRRQLCTLTMVAASSMADPSVLACQGTALENLTTEGYPGARYHAGCEYVDRIERLAIERAKAAFGARYANVQPHSGSSANAIALLGLLQPGDRILGLDLDCGGHLTHGSRASFSGQQYQAFSYGLDPRGFIDYANVGELALKHRPKLIICGASAYPRFIDFERFRAIADEVGALLLADISHIAGLVAAGVHPSPIDHAHLTTTSTYKQLYGPRGGLILSGRDSEALLPNRAHSLAEVMQRAVFPRVQGTPMLSAIAAKARALALIATPRFHALAHRIVEMANALGQAFVSFGYRVLTGGTDNHMVLIDVSAHGLTGLIAERALESCGIVVNKNRIQHDRHSARVTSGIRFGTNVLALRELDAGGVRRSAELVHRVLSRVEPEGTERYRLDAATIASVRDEVSSLCTRFPVPRYPWYSPAPVVAAE
jgi:glycine hydroxymethyltransferase